MNENKFKQELKEEIKYYRTHTLEEINVHFSDERFNNLVDEIENKRKKDIYDALSESEIEEYVNKSWLKYSYTNDINKEIYSRNDSLETRLLIEKVEDFGVEDYKFKEGFKQKIKETIKQYGIVFLSAECLASVMSLAFQSPAFFAIITASITTILALYLGVNMFKDGVIPLIDKNKAVEILQEHGIYDKLVEKMNVDKDLEEIENKGKVR